MHIEENWGKLNSGNRFMRPLIELESVYFMLSFKCFAVNRITSFGTLDPMVRNNVSSLIKLRSTSWFLLIEPSYIVFISFTELDQLLLPYKFFMAGTCKNLLLWRRKTLNSGFSVSILLQQRAKSSFTNRILSKILSISVAILSEVKGQIQSRGTSEKNYKILRKYNHSLIENKTREKRSTKYMV